MARFEECKNILANLLFEEETFWQQRAKAFWLKDGDINSKYFHAAATSKREANRIRKLHDENGNVFEEPSEFHCIARNYFTKLFIASHDPNYEVAISHVKSVVNAEDNEFLLE